MEALKKCIVTGDDIIAANDSKAHVIPSALGGRLKPKGILSTTGNGILDDKFDYPLVEAFQAIMNMIGGSRDRGENQPTRMKDKHGREYVFEFGKSLTPAGFEYHEEEVGDEIRICIQARTLKELRTLLGRVKKKQPEFDIDEAVKHAVTAHTWPDGALHVGLQLGPRVLFPWAFSAAAVFATYHGQPRHPGFRPYANGFDLSNPPMPPDTFYFMPGKAWVSASSELTHFLVLIGDPAEGRMLFYAEMFNAFSVGVTWPYAGDREICETYAVDVIAGQEVVASVDVAAVLAMPWSATHKLGDAELYARSAERMNAILKLSLDRQWDRELKDLVTRAWGPADGRPLMPEDQLRFLEELVGLTERLWSNPAVTPEIRAEMTARFTGICQDRATKVPPPLRTAFGLLLKPLFYRLRLADESGCAREAATQAARA